MKTSHRIKMALPLILVLAAMLLALPALSQPDGGYALLWSSADGSYAVSAGGDFRLGGISGPVETGHSGGGRYTLQGGPALEQPLLPPTYRLSLPLLLKDN